jgi:post-segregation antitoxin (ccd killing protein)
MAKRKLTITVDEELLVQLDSLGVENISATVNAAIVRLVEERLRLQALEQLVEGLIAVNGEPTAQEFALAEALFDELEAGNPTSSAFSNAA